MFAGIKNLFCIILGWMILRSFTQADTRTRKVDSALAILDSTAKKDTLLIKYVPIIPKSFQLADANHFSFLHGSIIDSNYNPLKDYKTYFAQKKNAFKLYNELITKSNDSPLIYRIEQRFSLPDKDLLFYGIFGLLFLFLLYTISILNIFQNYSVSLISLL